jgi:exonuclease SbcC
MQPLYLYLKDFMLHGESSIDFTKLSPATAIIGMEDSNLKNSIAVGKTTIFHAINYALYNAKPSTNINKIIRDTAKKAEVIFDFSMSDGNIYRIERTRTKSTQNLYLKVKVNDSWKDITDRTNSLTEQKILDIIKINQETFENSSYFKQGDQENLASATPAKRKEIIRDILHLEEWSVYEKKAKSIRDDYSNKLSIVKKTIDNLGNPQFDCENLQLELFNIESSLYINNSYI